MVQVLPQAPSLAELLGAGIGSGFETGSKMGLTSFLKNLSTQSNALNKFKQSFSSNFAKQFKDRYSKEEWEALSPEQKQNLENSIMQTYLENPDQYSAFQKGFSAYETASKQEEQARRDPALGQYKGGLLDSLTDVLGITQGAAEQRPITPLLQKQPSAIARRPLAGLTEGFEMLSKLNSPLQSALDIFTPRNLPKLSEMIRGSEEGLSEEEKAAGQQLETAGAFLPDIVIPFLGGEKAALTGVEEVQKAIKGATKAEEIAGLAPKALKVTEAPKGATLSRISKVAKEAKPFEAAKEAEIFQQQIKKFPKFAEEIQVDAAKRLKSALKIKRAETFANEAVKMETAAREIQPLKEAYETNIARMRTLEEEIARSGPGTRSKLEELLNLFKSETAKSENELNKALSLAKTGNAKATTEEITRNAFNQVQKVREMANDFENPISLSKRDYNPERVKLYQQLSKKELPVGKEISDYHQKLYKTYESMYDRRLNELANEIKEATTKKDLGSLMAYKRERDVLNQLKENAKAEQFLHDRNLRLRQIEQRNKIAEKVKTLRPTQEPKVSQKALQTINNQAKEYIKTPSAENLQKLSSSSGVPPEQIKNANETIGDFVKGMGQKVEDAFSKGKNKTGFFRKSFQKDVIDFVNTFKKSPSEAMTKTSTGRNLLANMFNLSVEAVTGKSFPYFRQFMVAFESRSPSRQAINLLFKGLSKGIVMPARKTYLREQLRDAVKNKDREKIIELRSKLTAKERQKALKG